MREDRVEPQLAGCDDFCEESSHVTQAANGAGGSFSEARLDELRGELWESVRLCLDERNHLSYFAVLDYQFVALVEDELKSGRFRNPGLVRRVMVPFFSRFQTSLERRLSHAQAEPIWQRVFQAKARLAVPQHILLGLNASLLFDLGFVIGTTLTPQEMRQFEADFLSLNQIFATQLSLLWSRLAATSLSARAVRKFCEPWDRELMVSGLEGVRNYAWSFAERLTHADAAEREQMVKDALAVAEEGARSICAPRFTTRCALLVASRLNSGDPNERIMRLFPELVEEDFASVSGVRNCV